jgi:hypothetical protein
MHNSGRRLRTGRNARRSTTSSSHAVIATASAVRSLPSSSAISPNISPSPMILKTASLPSLDGTLIRTRPCKMAIMLWPGSPLAKIVARAGYRVRCADARMASASSSLSPENRRVPLRRSRPLANADPIKFSPNQPKSGRRALPPWSNFCARGAILFRWSMVPTFVRQRFQFRARGVGTALR